MGGVLTALGTMGAIIAFGWVLGRRGTLGSGASTVLARVVFTIATPCLLLVTVSHADLHLLLSRQALVTAVSTAVVALLAVAVLRGLWHRPAGEATIGVLSASYVNAAYIGLPVAVYVLGDALAVVTPMLFQQLVLAPVAFVVLDGMAGGAGQVGPDGRTGAAAVRAAARRTARNPVLLGTMAGLALAALPFQLPEVVFEPFSVVGAAAAPLALLTFGMSLSGPRATTQRAPGREVALVAALRGAVHPAIAAGLGLAVGLRGHALLTVVVMACLPTAQNVLVYAIQYGRGQALARDAGLVTTLIAVPSLLVVTALLG